MSNAGRARGGAPLAHRPVSCVVGPGRSINTGLEFKFGDPGVALRTTLDYYPSYFPNLVQVDLDPAGRGCGGHKSDLTTCV